MPTKYSKSVNTYQSAWLATNGTAAIVCYPGIFYRAGTEQKIRKFLIDNNYIDSIIHLPENLFFGPSISTCILVLKKSKSDNKTLFIDASDEFIKITKMNKLTDENMANILEYYNERTDKEFISRLVEYDEFVANNYTLSVNNYEKRPQKNSEMDIADLNFQIAEMVKRENALRAEIDNIICDIEFA